MTDTHVPRPDAMAGPVAPTPGTTRLAPLAFDRVRVTEGFWADRQRRNHDRALPEGNQHLVEAGAWTNFTAAAEHTPDHEYQGPVFEDGEVFKWLEAVAWEQGREPAPEFERWLTERAELAAAAQDDDGYLNTFVQVTKPDRRFELLGYDHEIFNVGTLIQAAVARWRASGDKSLLEVAVRAADQLDATFGPGRRTGVCGHPLTEMALVELYRVTNESRYLGLARYFVDARGHHTLSDPYGHFGSTYYSDDVPVLQTTTPEGHAVRAMYLAAGATDVAVEQRDDALLAAVQRQWTAMVESKMYVTGGLGSRWEGEAFGAPYELPADRAYAETCAAIASLQWSWRLLLATGESRYADLVEHQLYNAVLPGISHDGDAYFYVNALQLREGSKVDDAGKRSPAFGRQHWFGCSCCPTNIMRTVASVHHYFATGSDDGGQLHQYATGRYEFGAAAGETMVLDVETAYPWNGTVTVTVVQAPERSWELALRVPAWSAHSTFRDRVGVESTPAAGDYLRVSETWRAGDTVTLELDFAPRWVEGHPRVDSARGALAAARGPLVYCVEQVDQRSGVVVDDLRTRRAGVTVHAVVDPVLGELVTLAGAGTVPGRNAPGESVSWTAVPYFLWANRGVGPMKVWLPLDD